MGEDDLLRRILAAAEHGPDGPDLSAVADEIGDALATGGCRLAVAELPRAPADAGQPTPEPPAELAGLRLRTVRFGGELVGWLGLPATVIGPGSRRRLLRHIVVVLGPVLDAARLTMALRRELDAAVAHADAIASARRRTVAAMDEQRRVLERNLHDGAQHHLVHLRLQVGLLEHQLGTGDHAGVADRLRILVDQLAAAETVLHDTAGGILPVSLVTGGLRAAVEAEIGPQTGVTLRLPDGPRRRYPQVVETAVFYACLEAVTNARKHAPDAAITVTMRDTYGGLWFSVRDDGPGFDPAVLPEGSGLGRLSDRVAAVGGTVTISSSPGLGTELEGVVPI